MQLSTKTVFFFLACVVCVSFTAASYTGTLAYLTPGCTGPAGGGQAEFNACTLNSTGNATVPMWTVSTCSDTNAVNVWRCATADCAMANCTLFDTLPACTQMTPYYLSYVCYPNATVVPDVVGNTAAWSYSVFSDGSCANLEARFWAPIGTCVAGFPDDTSSTMATCTSTGLSLVEYNTSMLCAGTHDTELVPSGCLPVATVGSLKAVCTLAPTTTAAASTAAASTVAATSGSSSTTGNHTTAGTTGSTGASTGSGTGTGGSTTTGSTTAGATTSTSSASALAASTLLFVAAVFAAL